MSLNLDQKKTVVSSVSESISGAKAAVLAEYRGLTVEQMTTLRTEARDNNVYFKVIKNTLAKRAVEGTDFESLSEHLTGPVAFAASEDPVAVAKVISNFAKDNDALKITAGVMDGNPISEAEIGALAKLPSRDELLAKLIGTMQAPIQKFVSTLNEVPSSFVRTLGAIRDAKPADGAAAPAEAEAKPAEVEAKPEDAPAPEAEAEEAKADEAQAPEAKADDAGADDAKADDAKADE